MNKATIGVVVFILSWIVIIIIALVSNVSKARYGEKLDGIVCTETLITHNPQTKMRYVINKDCGGGGIQDTINVTTFEGE